MEDKSEKPKSDISTTVWVLALVACLIFDFISLIPGAGDVEDVPASIVFIVGLILGVGPAINIIQGVVIVLKLFPVVQEWPWWTTGWVVAVVIELISKIFPAIKPLVQVGEKAAEIKSGNVGAVGKTAEVGAAAKGTQEAENVTAKEGEKANVGAGGGVGEERAQNNTQEATKTRPESGEAPQAPKEEEPSVLDEEGGNAIKNLQEGLLEPAPEEGEPQAPLPYQKDEPRSRNNVIEFPGSKEAGVKKEKTPPKNTEEDNLIQFPSSDSHQDNKKQDLAA